MTRAMRLLAICVGLASAACQTISLQEREDLLLQAGFTQKQADTPEKIAKMRTLAAHKFNKVVQNGRLVFVYPDPNVCNCIYLGYEEAFERYRKLLLARGGGDEEAVTVALDRDFNTGFLWGWGRGY